MPPSQRSFEASSPSAVEWNRIRMAVCRKSIQWPTCQGPIFPASASALRLVASEPTPKIPPVMGKTISLSCGLIITRILRSYAGVGASHLCQLKLESASADAVAFHQELCDMLVEQLHDRMLLDTCSLHSPCLMPWISQGRCGCSAATKICSSMVGTGTTTGVAPPAGSSSVLAGAQTPGRCLTSCERREFKKIVFI